MDVQFVQVKTLEESRLLFRDPGELPLERGEICTVESVHGEVLAEVLGRPWTSELFQTVERDRKKPFFKVLRRAAQDEVERFWEDRKLELKAKQAFHEAQQQNRIALKLVKPQVRGNKVTFLFTAEGRVDFRDLVRHLGSVLQTKIEMRQIGVRDEARQIGGIGRCGQETCCTRFLPNFMPVSMKHAKNQGLSLIPSKISGQCGRLLCCLTYENEIYTEARKHLPRHNDFIETEKGQARLRGVDYLRRTIRIEVQDVGEVTVPEENLERVEGKHWKAEIPAQELVPEHLVGRMVYGLEAPTKADDDEKKADRPRRDRQEARQKDRGDRRQDDRRKKDDGDDSGKSRRRSRGRRRPDKQGGQDDNQKQQGGENKPNRRRRGGRGRGKGRDGNNTSNPPNTENRSQEKQGAGDGNKGRRRRPRGGRNRRRGGGGPKGEGGSGGNPSGDGNRS